MLSSLSLPFITLGNFLFFLRALPVRLFITDVAGHAIFPTSRQDTPDDTLVFGAIFMAEAMELNRVMGDTRSTWQLGELEEHPRMERLGDLSRNGAFGRCLAYRVDVSGLPPEEMARACKELHAFHLCRFESQARLIRPTVPVRTVTSDTPLNGWETTHRARALYRGLPYEVKFLIEVCSVEGVVVIVYEFYYVFVFVGCFVPGNLFRVYTLNKRKLASVSQIIIIIIIIIVKETQQQLPM